MAIGPSVWARAHSPDLAAANVPARQIAMLRLTNPVPWGRTARSSDFREAKVSDSCRTTEVEGCAPYTNDEIILPEAHSERGAGAAECVLRGAARRNAMFI
jgi:hypothetical protein